MKKLGYIEIHASGFSSGVKLTPESMDIKEIMHLMENAEKLLFPGEKKDRPTISYSINEGSVKHIFTTSIQAIIAFNAILGEISLCKKIDFLESSTAKAIESIQVNSRRKGYSFVISTSLKDSNILTIDSTTDYTIKEFSWVDVEFYFYGKIIDAGGKEKANIHLLTGDFGLVKINTPLQFLADSKENILYKTFGVRAKGKQNFETGEIDKTSLEFLALVDYNTNYEQAYLDELRQKASGWLSNINPDNWLREVRGYES